MVGTDMRILANKANHALHRGLPLFVQAIKAAPEGAIVDGSITLEGLGGLVVMVDTLVIVLLLPVIFLAFN